MTRLLLRALGLLCCALPAPLLGQELRGLVLLPDSVTPAARVLVEVAAPTGAPRRLLTGPDGRFALTLEPGDTVRIRALRPGLRPTVAPALVAAKGARHEVRLVLRADRVALAPVTVVEDQACGRRGERAANELWAEARTVLEGIVLTERDSALQMRFIEYEGRPRDLADVRPADASVRIVSLDEAHGRGYYRDLFRFGFIQRGLDGVTTYHAPNAAVLTDERFVRSHCLRMAPEDTLADDVVGVRFEPRHRPGVTDVMGTAWLDVESYELRRVDFAYVNPPVGHRRADIGGTIEFARLATGHWITRHWETRMAVPDGTGLPGLRVRRQDAFQVTHDESLVFRDEALDRLARRVRAAAAGGMR